MKIKGLQEGELFAYNKGIAVERVLWLKEIELEREYWKTSSDVNVDVKTRISDALNRILKRRKKE